MFDVVGAIQLLLLLLEILQVRLCDASLGGCVNRFRLPEGRAAEPADGTSAADSGTNIEISTTF